MGTMDWYSEGKNGTRNVTNRIIRKQSRLRAVKMVL